MQYDYDKKKNTRVTVGLTILITGILIVILGVVLTAGLDVSKFKDEIKEEDFSRSYSGTDFDEVEIDTGAGKFSIVFDENAKEVTADIKNGDPDEIGIKNDDGKLKIVQHSGGFFFGFDFRNFSDFDRNFKRMASGKDGSIFKGILSFNSSVEATITIPGKEYNSIDIDGGAGELIIKDPKCREFNVDSGAGEVTIDGLYAQKTDIDMGAGEVKVNGEELGKVDLDGGVGSADIKGKMGDVDADCGVGDLKLTVIGSSDDYDVDGGADVHGGGSESTGEHYNIVIDMGVGDADVYFE